MHEDPAATALALEARVTRRMRSTEHPTDAIGQPLAGSLLPWIDRALPDGRSREEWKGDAETNRILGLQPPCPWTACASGSVPCGATPRPSPSHSTRTCPSTRSRASSGNLCLDPARAEHARGNPCTAHARGHNRLARRAHRTNPPHEHGPSSHFGLHRGRPVALGCSGARAPGPRHRPGTWSSLSGVAGVGALPGGLMNRAIFLTLVLCAGCIDDDGGGGQGGHPDPHPQRHLRPGRRGGRGRDHLRGHLRGRGRGGGRHGCARTALALVRRP